MAMDTGPPGLRLSWDINDPQMPQEPVPFDHFCEWPDGHVRLVYPADERRAQRHLSGWAMRNTNNHKGRVLKKSCLGVVLCARGCVRPDGSRLCLRPAICDRARRKQRERSCPGCHSALEFVPCRGHSGYPVTNFWRLDGDRIFFQAKGVHDHPRPESKAESEARRGAIRRQTPCPCPYPSQPRRRAPGMEAGGSGASGGHTLGPTGPEMVRGAGFLLPGQPCFSVDMEAYTAAPGLAALHGHLSPPFQKRAEPALCLPRPPCSHELAGPPPSPAGPAPGPHRDSSSAPPDSHWVPAAAPPWGVGWPGGLEGHAEVPSKHHGWWPALRDGPVAARPDRHPQPPCRCFPGPAAGAPGLQAVFATRVSYQALPAWEQAPEGSSLWGWPCAPENVPLSLCPEASDLLATLGRGPSPQQAPGGCGASRGAPALPQEPAASGSGGAETWGACPPGRGAAARLAEPIHPLVGYDCQDF